MLTTSLVLVLAVGAPAPDESDVFKGSPGLVKNVMVVDGSGSMGSGSLLSNCTYYAQNYNGSDLNLNKNDQLKAALTGCQFASDGVIDKWADQINLAVLDFPSFNLLAPFGSSPAGLEAGVLSLPASGNTPMSRAIGEAGEYLQTYWDKPGTPACSKLFVLLLSDGNPNASDYTLNNACDASSVVAPAGQPWQGAGYLANRDFLCSLPGQQEINVYSIGFGAPGSFNETVLQNVANWGGGVYAYASNVSELNKAYSDILFSMATRAVVYGSPPAVQRDGLFAGNHAYVASFKPMPAGPWYGNLRKHKLFPDRNKTTGLYDTSESTTLFTSPDGIDLQTNVSAADLWSGSRDNREALLGGAGAKLRSRLTGMNRPRHIVSWRDGTPGYIDVDQGTWKGDDAWMAASELDRFLNFVHGYTWEADASGNPLQLQEWPLGDPFHSASVLLRYGDCEKSAGQCYVAMSSNDGTVRFFDAYDGQETQTLIPSEVWGANVVAKNQLRDIADQPNQNVSHRYMLDSVSRLFHDDLDADGIIDGGEEAYLIFGFGRGGRGYYRIPLTRFNGTLDPNANPVQPFLYQAGTVAESLQETWAAPGVGKISFNGKKVAVAIVPSGHVSKFDEPTAKFPAMAPGPDNFTTITVTCQDAALASGLDPLQTCSRSWYDLPWFPLGTGYPDTAPVSMTYGPFNYPNAIAYRFNLNLDVDPNDKLFVGTTNGRNSAALTGKGVAAETWSNGLNGGWTDWVYDSQVRVSIDTDGTMAPPPGHKGAQILGVQIKLRTPGGPAVAYPAINIVDMKSWNGGSPQNFTSKTADGGVLVQISKQCTGSPKLCVDAGSSPDLAYMTAPISGEVALYSVAGRVRALYWGTEAGEIYKASYSEVSGKSAWKVRRILKLNAFDDTNQTPVGVSKDFRKIFRKLDLVPSTCPGKRVIGIYFGSGNVQRPLAEDEIASGGLNYGVARDIIGVVWDDNSGATYDLMDLVDATNVSEVDPKKIYASKKMGWFIQLDQNERMLRDPVVIEGNFFAKTFRPNTKASTCSAATGVDAIYAINNCSAEAIDDRNNNGVGDTSERKVWEKSVDIGGDILVMAPPDSKPIVSHGDPTHKGSGSLTKLKKGHRVPQILNFRWRR